MNGKGFQALVAQLGDLSVVQREALIAALKGRLSLDEAIELIDRRFKAEPCCGHCGSKSVGGWSSQNGLARYRCRDCTKTFQRADRHAARPIASPRRVVQLCQSARRRPQFEEGRRSLRHLARHLVPLASSFSGRRKRREGQNGEGHCHAGGMLTA